MRNDKTENIIVKKTFNFALQIIDYTEALKEERKYRLADQLFRSGTSIGANVKESQNAESKRDFIHKMKIAAKEADETEYWLELCEASPKYPTNEILLGETRAIIRILSKIISTSKKEFNLKMD
ncbi:MAG: four helix bundle protein [Bacteroidetes bacterium]|nr:four helix bundle protein [Bacteroidota bacterium]